MSTESGRDIEVIVQGREGYLLGFVRGLLIGERSQWWPVFNHEFGIQNETLAETLKEWVGLSDPLTRFIVPEAALPVLRRALADPRSVGLTLREARPILSASFEFTVAVYNAELGRKVREIFTKVPPGVVVAGLSLVEEEDPDATGVELYSPAHDYELKGKGTVSGSFRDVLYVHEQARREGQISESRLALELGPVLQ